MVSLLSFLFFLLTLPSLLLQCFALRLQTPKTVPVGEQRSPQQIQRVAIIGCGIAGLSLAHALQNSIASEQSGASSSNKIQPWLFDSRPSLNFEAGAGIQLSGGMNALYRINPKLHSAVASAALPLTHVRSRAKPWFESDKEPFSTLLELDLEKSVKDAGGEVEQALIIDGKAQFYTIMRGALQQVLFEQLPPEVSQRTTFQMTLSGINFSDKEQGIMCHFDNGKVEGPFDLVVGCDGIKSAVKQYVERGFISTIAEKGGGEAIYSGIRIQYAVQDDKLQDKANSPKSAELRQYFGDGAYALTGTYGAGKDRAPIRSTFLIFRDENYIGPFKRRIAKKAAVSSKVSENADWTQDVKSTGNSRADFLARINESGTPSQEITPIVELADRFFELGVYFHNPFSLTGWKRKVSEHGNWYCVLAGDAAHALPPFLGQGGNQAIQDASLTALVIFLVLDRSAFSLASMIREFNSLSESSDETLNSEDKIMKRSLKGMLDDYEKRRWGTTTSISLKAALLGYLETGSAGFLSKFRDAFFTFAGKTGLARTIFLGGATPRY